MTTTSTTPDTAGVTEHPNARRIREAFEAFSRGDLETVRLSATDDATWTNAGSGPLAGTYRGWSEIVGMFGRLVELTGGTYRLEVRSVVADDSHGFAVYDSTSTVAGRTATNRWVLVDELAPDGRSTATRVFCYDQEAADRHLSGQAG